MGATNSSNGSERGGLGVAALVGARAMAWIMRRLLRLSLLRSRWSHRAGSGSSSTTGQSSTDNDDQPLHITDVHARLLKQERALAQAYMRVARGPGMESESTWSLVRCAAHHAIVIGSSSPSVTTSRYSMVSVKGCRTLTRFRLEICPAASSELSAGCKPIEHSRDVLRDVMNLRLRLQRAFVYFGPCG